MSDHMVWAEELDVVHEPLLGMKSNSEGWVILDSSGPEFELWDYESYYNFRYKGDKRLNPVRVYDTKHFYWWFEAAEDTIHINRWPRE